MELVAALLAVPVRQTEITRLGVKLAGKRRSRVMSRQNRDFFDSGQNQATAGRWRQKAAENWPVKKEARRREMESESEKRDGREENKAS